LDGACLKPAPGTVATCRSRPFMLTLRGILHTGGTLPAFRLLLRSAVLPPG